MVERLPTGSSVRTGVRGSVVPAPAPSGRFGGGGGGGGVSGVRGGWVGPVPEPRGGGGGGGGGSGSFGGGGGGGGGTYSCPDEGPTGAFPFGDSPWPDGAFAPPSPAPGPFAGPSAPREGATPDPPEPAGPPDLAAGRGAFAVDFAAPRDFGAASRAAAIVRSARAAGVARSASKAAARC